jgi:hypothetical protein
MKIEDAIAEERRRGGTLIQWDSGGFVSTLDIGGDWFKPWTPPKPREWVICETHGQSASRHYAPGEANTRRWMHWACAGYGTCHWVTVVEKP